ncbi:5,10-methylenetetrahydrofolate reductase [bacterium B17]|nr:5,10-methylenetetrahydrofolate reductase [bacterium B17]
MSDKELKSDSKLEQALASGKFAITGELGPPKSADAAEVKENAEHLKDVVHAANITDNQTAIVRMSSFAAAVLAMESGVEPVMQITCRDRNRLAIQSDVLGAYALGIRNILCLTGDHQCFGNHPTSKNVYDMDSIQLISMLKKMRDEKQFDCGDEIRNTKKAPVVEPKIFIGAAANPFGDPIKFRAIRLAKKINAGADFIQTQCIYDMPRFKEWMKEVSEMGLHEKTYILAGITPLKSARMAEYMRDSVAGLTVPDEIVKRLKDADDPKAEGQKMAVEQIQEIREIPGVSGVHVMAIGAEETVPGLLKDANLSI